MRFLSYGALGLVSFAMVGCADKATEDPPPPSPTARATWYHDVAPIVAQHCMTCHQDGGIGPFSLTDYDSAKENAQRMLDNVNAGIMPPFDAREDADCTPRFGWVDDPRLDATEKQTLQNWLDDGLVEGDVEPIPAIPTTDLTGVSKTLTPTEGWAAAGDRDQFVCFIFDPGTTELTWMTGMQVLPDKKEVVHHAVITELQPSQATTDLVNAHGIGKPFDCSTMATPADFVVHIWTPGNNPMETDGNIAVPIVANAKLVMQIHYHPAGLAHDPDKTAIAMRFSQTWPQRMYFVTAFGNAFQSPELLPDPDDVGGQVAFVVPKNVPDHVEHMRFTVPDLGGLQDVRLYSANPHMHLIGTHIAGTIERPAARGNDPQTECLANGGWNFDWQRTYTYDAPLDRLPSVATGDVLDIKCHWNNTLDNPFVQRMLTDINQQQPIDVTLGEQTTNEMCLEIFGLALQAPAQPSALEAPLTTVNFPPGLAQMQLAASMK